MPTLPERLLKTIREQEFLRPGDRVAVAVSGGADSAALLLLLRELRSELGIVLSVAHVNHKLRGEESDADEQFVAELARKLRLEFHVCSAPPGPPRTAGIEAAARKLRYDFFRDLTRELRVSKIATAHTLDDQAETILMRIMRGAGLRGLAGIRPRLRLAGKESPGEVIRPLLGFRRAELQQFLRDRGQPWREDSTNLDPKFLRNRVRHVLLPVLTTNFGDPVVENLAGLAEIARAEEEHWRNTHPEVRPRFGPLAIAALSTLGLAARRRLVRDWLEASAPDVRISFRLIEDVLALADAAPDSRLELHAGYRVHRDREYLCVQPPQPADASDYEYCLSIPGEVAIPELGVRLQASLSNPGDVPDNQQDFLLDPGCLPPSLTVRNWRAGDRYWPAHTRAPRKVKELLSDRRVTGTERKLWPVMVAGQDLVWMRGFPTPADQQPLDAATWAVWIREIQGNVGTQVSPASEKNSPPRTENSAQKTQN